MVWAVTYFHLYLYGHSVTVLTNHTAVKAVLETPNPNGKHARWWSKIYGRGIKEVKIVHRAGKTNLAADALSRSPQAPAPTEGIGQGEVQISKVVSQSVTVSELLKKLPVCESPADYGQEQGKIRSSWTSSLSSKRRSCHLTKVKLVKLLFKPPCLL